MILFVHLSVLRFGLQGTACKRMPVSLRLSREVNADPLHVGLNAYEGFCKAHPRNPRTDGYTKVLT